MSALVTLCCGAVFRFNGACVSCGGKHGVVDSEARAALVKKSRIEGAEAVLVWLRGSDHTTIEHRERATQIVEGM